MSDQYDRRARLGGRVSLARLIRTLTCRIRGHKTCCAETRVPVHRNLKRHSDGGKRIRNRSLSRRAKSCATHHLLEIRWFRQGGSSFWRSASVTSVYRPIKTCHTLSNSFFIFIFPCGIAITLL
jgi:hypothetical protein